MPSSFFPERLIEEASFTPPIHGVDLSTAAFIGVTALRGENNSLLNQAVLIESWETFIALYGRYTGSAPHMAPAVYGFFVNGGESCYIVSIADESAASLVGIALSQLDTIEDVAIVSMPGIVSQPVQQALLDHCERHGNRICILDPEQGASVNSVLEQRYTLSSARGYGVLYSPWIRMEVEKLSPSGEIIIKEVIVPPSGAIAGTYARNDREKGIHKAPTNNVISHAIGLESTMTKHEMDTLRNAQVNTLRPFIGRGIVAWGAMSLSEQNEWRSIHVRRLAMYIESSVARGTRWAVFERNNEAFWGRLRQAVEAFLYPLWRSGALVGSRSEEAYHVRCDRSTMTQNDIDSGKVVLLVGFAALKPAEYIAVRIEYQLGEQG